MEYLKVLILVLCCFLNILLVFNGSFTYVLVIQISLSISMCTMKKYEIITAMLDRIQKIYSQIHLQFGIIGIIP